MLRKRGRKRTGKQPETNSKLAVNFMNKLFLVRDIIGLSLLPSPLFPPLRFRFASPKPPSPIPRIALKVAPKRATNPLVPRIESKKYLPAKTQGRRHSQLPAPPQSGKSICDSGRKQPGAMRKRARKGRRLRTGGFQRAQPLARLW